jgi:hypothetical protein
MRTRLPFGAARPLQSLSRPFPASFGRAHIRHATTSIPPPGTPPTQRAASFLQRHTIIKYTLFGIGSIIFGLTATTTLILGYDAMTYKEAHVGNVPSAPLALHPNPGGPKKLPILSHFVEDSPDSEVAESKASKKERLVIVGGGWASVALLASLDPDEYDVTLIAPNNFFLL